MNYFNMIIIYNQLLELIQVHITTEAFNVTQI